MILVHGSDWCTLFPEYIGSVYIGDACRKHDRRYENTRITRGQADRLLYRDIRRRGLYFTAFIMYIGVRLFGWVFYGNTTNSNNERTKRL